MRVEERFTKSHQERRGARQHVGNLKNRYYSGDANEEDDLAVYNPPRNTVHSQNIPNQNMYATDLPNIRYGEDEYNGSSRDHYSSGRKGQRVSPRAERRQKRHSSSRRGDMSPRAPREDPRMSRNPTILSPPRHDHYAKRRDDNDHRSSEDDFHFKDIYREDFGPEKKRTGSPETETNPSSGTRTPSTRDSDGTGSSLEESSTYSGEWNNVNCMNTLFARNAHLIRCDQPGRNGELQVKMTLPGLPTPKQMNKTINRLRCKGGAKDITRECNLDYRQLGDQVIELEEQVKDAVLYKSLFESGSEVSTSSSDEDRSSSSYHRNSSPEERDSPSPPPPPRITSLPSQILVKDDLSVISSVDNHLGMGRNGGHAHLSPSYAARMNRVSPRSRHSGLDPEADGNFTGSPRHGLSRMMRRSDNEPGVIGSPKRSPRNGSNFDFIQAQQSRVSSLHMNPYDGGQGPDFEDEGAISPRSGRLPSPKVKNRLQRHLSPSKRMGQQDIIERPSQENVPAVKEKLKMLDPDCPSFDEQPAPEKKRENIMSMSPTPSEEIVHADGVPLSLSSPPEVEPHVSDLTSDGDDDIDEALEASIMATKPEKKKPNENENEKKKDAIDPPLSKPDAKSQDCPSMEESPSLGMPKKESPADDKPKKTPDTDGEQQTSKPASPETLEGDETIGHSAKVSSGDELMKSGDELMKSEDGGHDDEKSKTESPKEEGPENEGPKDETKKEVVGQLSFSSQEESMKNRKRTIKGSLGSLEVSSNSSMEPGRIGSPDTDAMEEPGRIGGGARDSGGSGTLPGDSSLDASKTDRGYSASVSSLDECTADKKKVDDSCNSTFNTNEQCKSKIGSDSDNMDDIANELIEELVDEMAEEEAEKQKSNEPASDSKKEPGSPSKQSMSQLLNNFNGDTFSNFFRRKFEEDSGDEEGSIHQRKKSVGDTGPDDEEVPFGETSRNRTNRALEEDGPDDELKPKKRELAFDESGPDDELCRKKILDVDEFEKPETDEMLALDEDESAFGSLEKIADVSVRSSSRGEEGTYGDGDTYGEEETYEDEGLLHAIKEEAEEEEPDDGDDMDANSILQDIRAQIDAFKMSRIEIDQEDNKVELSIDDATQTSSSVDMTKNSNSRSSYLRSAPTMGTIDTPTLQSTYTIDTPLESDPSVTSSFRGSIRSSKSASKTIKVDLKSTPDSSAKVALTLHRQTVREQSKSVATVLVSLINGANNVFYFVVLVIAWMRHFAAATALKKQSREGQTRATPPAVYDSKRNTLLQAVDQETTIQEVSNRCEPRSRIRCDSEDTGTCTEYVIPKVHNPGPKGKSRKWLVIQEIKKEIPSSDDASFKNHPQQHTRKTSKRKPSVWDQQEQEAW